MVNPWQKRAEDAKAKIAASSRPAITSSPSDTTAHKENQRPTSASRRKANSVSSIPRESLASTVDDIKRPSGSQGKRANDVRNNGPRPNSKAVTDDTRTDSPLATSSSAIQTERQSEPSLSSAPPSVKDDVSWPTPESAQEKERRDTTEKDVEEKRDEDATPTVRRKKPEWKVMPVVPNVIFDTPQSELRGSKPRGPPNGERTNRGGNGSRGRGGHRGAPNGINGGDRQTSRSNSAPNNQDPAASTTTQRNSLNAADRDTVALPPRPNRASSASPRDEQKDSLPDRNLQAKSLTEETSPNSSAQDTAKTTSSSFATPFSEARRTKSPKKMHVPNSELKEDEYMPRPIPRRNSSGTQTTEAAEGTEGVARDGPPIRMVPSETRKEPRNFDSTRDATTWKQAWRSRPRWQRHP